MKTTTNMLLSDIEHMSEHLSFEETLIIIECAKNVRKHLLKSIESGNDHHSANLQLVNSIIDTHTERLFDGCDVAVV
ncbi:MAG: hypothetical protein ABJN36_15625 [Cyclobacteriaceae bacterium]